jgi:hypothetical protein
MIQEEKDCDRLRKRGRGEDQLGEENSRKDME